MDNLVLILVRNNKDQFEYTVGNSPLYATDGLVEMIKDWKCSVRSNNIIDYLEEYADFEITQCSAILVDTGGEVTSVNP